MGWLRLVGSLKLQVSFAEYSLFYRARLQKRPIIFRSLLIRSYPIQADVQQVGVDVVCGRDRQHLRDGYGGCRKRREREGERVKEINIHMHKDGAPYIQADADVHLLYIVSFIGLCCKRDLQFYRSY